MCVCVCALGSGTETLSILPAVITLCVHARLWHAGISHLVGRHSLDV